MKIKFISLVLLHSLSACVVDIPEDPPEEEGEVTEKSPEPSQGTPYTGTPEPEHNLCDPLYKEGLYGHVIEIPVDCQPIIINPYSQKENWLVLDVQEETF